MMPPAGLAAFPARFQGVWSQLSAAVDEAEGALQAAGASFGGALRPPPDLAAALGTALRAAEKVPVLLASAAQARAKVDAVLRPTPLAVPAVLREIAAYLEPRDALALALTSRVSHACLKDALCHAVTFGRRGERRAALLLARDAAGAQRIAHVRKLAMLHYSLLAALRKGILAECNDGLRSLWCSADRPEDFRAFACLSLPGLQFLSVALEASCLAEEDLRPGMVRVSFPALRRLVFRAGSELAFSDQLWRGLDAGAPALDVIELDLWSLGGEDRIDGIRNVPKRLRAAIAVLSVRDPVQISQIAKLGLHGFAPKKVSAMRHEDDDLDAFFKKPFDEAWKDLCAMERLTHFETSWFPSRAFDRGIPPRLKRIDAEVLCFDEAPSLERDRRIGGLQISAKKFELGGRPVGKYMARILRKNLW